MKLLKRMTVSTIAVMLLTATLGGLPLRQQGAEAMPWLTAGIADAAASELPSGIFLQRMNELHAALAAGDPADVQDVRNLRDEIAGLKAEGNHHLLDPVWNKISSKLPESADKMQLKASLFALVKAVGSFRYDPGASHLEAIRTNPEYRATLKTIAAAGGDADIVVDDFLIFLFGDGESRKGVEGTVRDLLAGMTPIQLMALLGDNQGITAILLQAMEQLLGNTEAYKFSSILKQLGVTPQDVRATVLNFQVKLQKDVPAIRAMTVAYLRTGAQEMVEIGNNGRQHQYSLKVFGIDVPALVLSWSKVSGSADVTVQANGTVTIPEGIANASAVIQAALLNPYGGANKVIFQQEVTLTADDQGGGGDPFPSELFLERMIKLREALLAGDPADVADVRRLRDEIAALDVDQDQVLIHPIWKRIEPNLPASVDAAKLKRSLFAMLLAVGSFQYDPQASDLEAIRTNPEFRAALKTLAAAGGVDNITMDDFLILMFGDGDKRPGIEGAFRNKIGAMSLKQLSELLGSPLKLNALLNDALIEILSAQDDYAVSKVFYNLDVRPIDVMATVLSFQIKLKHEQPAMNAMAVAYVRSEVLHTVKVTGNGRQHHYELTFMGKKLTPAVIEWSKVSGDSSVKVGVNGQVSIPNHTPEGKAVVQAALVNPYGGAPKVIFKQEVTLVAKGGGGDDGGGGEPDDTEVKRIIEDLQGELAAIAKKLDTAVNDEQKIRLIIDVARAANDSYKKIEKADTSNGIKEQAIAETKKLANEAFQLIIHSLLDF